MMLSSSQTPAAPADFSHLLYKSLRLRLPDFQPSLMQQGRSPGQPGPGSASPQPAQGCSSCCCPCPSLQQPPPPRLLQRFALKRTNLESNGLPVTGVSAALSALVSRQCPSHALKQLHLFLLRGTQIYSMQIRSFRQKKRDKNRGVTHSPLPS